MSLGHRGHVANFRRRFMIAGVLVAYAFGVSRISVHATLVHLSMKLSMIVISIKDALALLYASERATNVKVKGS